jgi:polysaccharide chain length determinant protein (PEP-CTERM system associated)
MLPGRKYSPDFFVSLLRKRWWQIALSVTICTFIGLLVSRTIPDLYRSDTLIQVVPQRVPDSYVRSTVTTDVDDRLKSIQQQIVSRTRLEQTIQEFDLYPDKRKAQPMEQVVQDMRNDIQIQLTGPNNGRPTRPGQPAEIDAFHVAFTYPDPLVAMRVTERLASWFIDENSRLRSSLAGATNEFLESQLLEAKARLEVQEQKVKEFRERHSGSLPTQLQTNLQAIQNLQLQLQALVESAARDRDRRLMLERLYNDAVAEEQLVAASPPPAAPATPGGAPVAATNRQRLEAARQQLAAYEQRLTPEHPDVLRTKAQIADLEKKVAEEGTQASGQPAAVAGLTPFQLQRRERISQMRAEIESLGRQIKFKESEEIRVRGQIAAYQSRIEAVPSTESEQLALSRDYETLQDAYKLLLTKSEESKVAANLERQQISEQFRTLDPPRVPQQPISPNRIQITGIAFALGLVLGLAIVGAQEFMDSTYRTEADVVSTLTLPVLAVVPHVVTTEEKKRVARRQRLALVATAVAAVVMGGLSWFLQLWRYVV